MSDKTKIEWAEASWNPVVGCSRVSDGCDHCYAIRQAHRIQAMQAAAGNASPYDGTTRTRKDGTLDWTGVVRLVPERLDQPRRWQRPRRIFVNSMSDLFHPSLSDDAILAVILAMYAAPQHVYQVLTKRPDRMARVLNHPPAGGLGFQLAQAALRAGWTGFKPVVVPVWPPPNVWWGTSVENQATADERIPHLLNCPGVRWLSMEPLLGPVNLGRATAYPDEQQPTDLDYWLAHLHWVVVGGESGPGARPMHPDWVRSLRDQCRAAGVPFFFKQWGQWVPQGHMPVDVRSQPERHWPWGKGDVVMWSVGKHAAGRLLDGRTWDEYPEVP